VADSDPISFTHASGLRIADAVHRIEGAGRGEVPHPKRTRHVIDGTGSGGTSVDIKIVLVDHDIDGVDEADPAVTFTADDVTLTDDETTAGYTVVFQNPVPDDVTDYDANHVDKLNLRSYRRQRVTAKYYKARSPANEGTAAGAGSGTDTLALDPASNPSATDDFYVGDVCTTTAGAGTGQTATVIAYDATTGELQLDADWATAVDNTTDYTITSTRNLELATTVIDDADNTRKIVRPATIDAWYDEGPIKLGTYGRDDYADVLGENDPLPPAPDGQPDYYKKPQRWLVINNVMIKKLCVEPAPPPLPE
jgi:hypothetical protein